MPRSDQIISYHKISHARIQLQAAAARGLLLGDRVVAWWSAKRGKESCTLYEEKSPVCIKSLRTYAGIGDAETQFPGMCRKPGDLSKVCPKVKKLERLATRDTQHGSRPDLQQREPDGRIVSTPPDVWDKGASTKGCARSKKKSQLYFYIYSATKKPFIMSERTLEKDKYEVGDNRTTTQHLSRYLVTLCVMLKNEPNMFLSSLNNSHPLRKRDLWRYPLSTYCS